MPKRSCVAAAGAGILIDVLESESLIGDAFGAALRRCHQAGQAPGSAFEVIERSDGLITVGDAARYFDGLDSWPSYEREAFAEISGRVLDIGCGAGRHAIALADAGAEVVGVDSSPGAVEVARDRGVDARLGSAIAPPEGIGQFSTILLLGHNLGLLGGEPQAVLTALADAAAPGARILGSGLDPYATTDPDHLRYHEHNRGLGRWPGQARIRIRHGRLATSFFDYLFCSESELAEAVRDSPWRLTEVRRDAGSSYLAIMRLR